MSQPQTPPAPVPEHEPPSLGAGPPEAEAEAVVAKAEEAVAERLDLQSGVISRRQALEAGLRVWDLRRKVRRREWAAVGSGVYLNHTGTPTWLQRAWIAVLALWPAALADESAIRAVVGPGWRHHDDDGPIHLAVAAGRRAAAPDGCRATRLVDFDERVQWNASPPRLRMEDAVLGFAARAPDDFAAIGRLADACQSRRTTAERLLQALERRPRLRRRAWIAAVLTDVAAGTTSVLEHAYLTRVLRPHGLPTGQLQHERRTEQGRQLRDVRHEEVGMEVELDGRPYHDTARQRDQDMERDLDAALDGTASLRLGWGQVVGRPCQTAVKLDRLFTSRGWTGRAHGCGAGCPVG